MKVVDVINPERINKAPDKTVVLLSSCSFVEQGLTVKKAQLNLYIQKKDEKLGTYSIITVYVETDKGDIEMTYDEGYRGENVLEEVAGFLTSHLGISSLILRSVLQLKNTLDKKSD
ncbi:MAG: hypothetical protein ACREAF_03680 [Nitrosopumilaceae archaeon]